MIAALRGYIAEYGWTGLITDQFSPTRGWLADQLRAIAERLNPLNKLDVVLAYEREMRARGWTELVHPDRRAARHP